MLMGVGVFLAIIGVIVSGVNFSEFRRISQEFFYSPAELESCKTYLIVGLVITIIGVLLSLSSASSIKKQIM